jgi:hypothetical protein
VIRHARADTVRPAAVSATLAERLLDADPLVARKARQVLAAVEDVSDAGRAA